MAEDCGMTKPTRGGARKGSGRKPDPNARKMVSLRLSLETVDYLATVDNKTEAIEAAVKNSKAFKAWKANRPKTAKGK